MLTGEFGAQCCLLVMGSHEEGEPISQFGGIVMSFRRSIWRSQRKATRRKSRNRQHSNQRRPAIESRSINGAKQVPESSAVHQGTPTPYSPVTDVLLVTTDSEQKSNGDPEKIDIAREEELEGNNALDTLESGQTYELTQITPTSQIIASDPMSDSSCSFVLSNSSPFIFGDTDSDDDYVQNSIPLINCKSASDSGSLDPEFEINSMCRHASCDCVLEGNSNIKDPEFSPVVSNAFTPYQNLGKQKKYSHSNCDILSTTKLQHDQKSKSVGDFTRVRNDSGSTKTIDAPKEHVRNVPFTLQWQASVDNLYGSPRLPRRKLRYHMRREEIRRGLTYDARDDSSIPGGRKKINPLSTGGHTQLRVAAIINNMKRSFSDLLHGDDTDRTHTGYSTSTFYDPSHSDDRTEC
ncbi:hypothetical protein Pmani_027779 [Petrolisthes manimaculis]|uniref:Uncharacterized protein n=1 Tax=Petrolisthes manimaculis TaxID=1843537 RepID=A0AAE1P0P2_9EUCA|nr:hypothetical protein Pmani_027779 [Petrolisthes manimaculis]